jgi:hypothetical protein
MGKWCEILIKENFQNQGGQTYLKALLLWYQVVPVREQQTFKVKMTFLDVADTLNLPKPIFD